MAPTSQNDSTRDPAQLITIVGMAGRFPGAADVDSFWRLLCTGGDAIRPVPAERWDAAAELEPDLAVQAVGGFLDGVDQFDPTFFAISPREAEDLDPPQSLLLEVACRRSRTRASRRGRCVARAPASTSARRGTTTSWSARRAARAPPRTAARATPST